MSSDAKRIDRPRTNEAVRAMIADDGRLRFVVGLSLGEIACSSNDGTYEGLNEHVEELLFAEVGGLLEDIGYRAVGVESHEGDPNGLILIEVDARYVDIDDHGFDDEDDDDEEDEYEDVHHDSPCPKSPDGRHAPDVGTMTANADQDPAVSDGVLYTIRCRHCGAIGDGLADAIDVDW